MTNNYFDSQNEPTPIQWPTDTWLQKRLVFLKKKSPKFETIFCSQCGQEFGPGDHGYSHCRDHRHDRRNGN